MLAEHIFTRNSHCRTSRSKDDLEALMGLAFAHARTQAVHSLAQYRWRCSFLRYASSAIYINEMSGLVLTRADGTLVRGEDLLVGDPLNNNLSVGENIAVLVAMLCGMRVLALLGLYLAKHRRWL